jgi:uracil-DNA glycosylase
MILIVGSNPSQSQPDPLIPFKGTKSEKTLMIWLQRLEISSYKLVNVLDVVTPKNRPLRVSEWNLERLRTMSSKASRIIALGTTASKALSRIEASHIRIGHPSGLNREYNKPEDVDKMIYKCYKYIHECK